MTLPESLSFFRPIAIGQTPQSKSAAHFTKIGSVLAQLRLWRDRYNGRRTIRAMTSEQIAELDLDPRALRREGEKPFWRA